MRLYSFSDDDEVLSGKREPFGYPSTGQGFTSAVPLSALANHPSSETWHTFVVRRSPDQEAIEGYVVLLEAQIQDFRDAVNMAEPEDLDEGAWRLLDRVESAHVALGFACRELRDLL